jgi:hypothetical protein
MVNKFMFIYGGTSYLILFTMSILLAGTSLGIGFAEDNDDLTKHDVDSLCDASEDYEGHEEECDKLYDQVEDDDDD